MLVKNPMYWFGNFPEIKFDFRNRWICVGLRRMLSKIHGYHNREVRDFLLHDHLWCLAKPRCIVKHELSRLQKLSKCVSKFSPQSFPKDWEHCISNLPEKGWPLSRSNLSDTTWPASHSMHRGFLHFQSINLGEVTRRFPAIQLANSTHSHNCA